MLGEVNIIADAATHESPKCSVLPRANQRATSQGINTLALAYLPKPAIHREAPFLDVD